MPTRGQVIADSAHLEELGKTVAARQASKEAKYGTYLLEAQAKLKRAQSIINGVDSAINSTSATKNIADEIFAPAKVVVSLLEAVADLHPAVKVIAVIVKGVVEIQIKAKKNDEQVAVVYYTMSTLLILLGDIDPVFDQEELHNQLQALLESVQSTVQDFGNFCEVYYRENRIKRYIKCGGYKEKLEAYATDFDTHKQDLRGLLQAQGAIKLIDIQIDIKKVAAYIATKSTKEQQTEQFLQEHGGEDTVLKNDKDLEALAKQLKEKLDIQDLRRSMRMDLDRALKANEESFKLQLNQVTAKIDTSLDGHTRTIITKLEEGPHEYIEDPDIRAVWKEMGSRLSAKTRVFLDAVNAYYTRIFLKYELEKGTQHPDVWALHFLSKIIFYPAIAEGIDEDSSGFVSVHEVNSFIKLRPGGWSVAQWFAFWAAGPYKTDVEHQEKIESMLDDLDSLVDAVADARPENTRRVKYFCGMRKKLRLITVYADTLNFYGEDGDGDGAYAMLEKLRVSWRNQEMKRVNDNLELTKYSLPSTQAVAAVINGRRLEQCVLCLIYLLLHRHLKIAKLATTQTVTVAEFESMRASWENLFDAFQQRMETLAEVWRQQRMDVKIQMQCFAGGIFEEWYAKDRAEEEESYEGDSDDDSEYDYEDEETEDDGDEQGPEEEGTAEEGQEEGEGGSEGHFGDAVPDALSAAQKTDLASALSNTERKKGEKQNPRDLLLYPDIPSEPENEDGLTTDSEASEWESPEVRKKKFDAALVKRMDTIEGRLETIEGLLQQLLTIQTSKSTKKRAAPATDTNASRESSHEPHDSGLSDNDEDEERNERTSQGQGEDGDGDDDEDEELAGDTHSRDEAENSDENSNSH